MDLANILALEAESQERRVCSLLNSSPPIGTNVPDSNQCTGNEGSSTDGSLTEAFSTDNKTHKRRQAHVHSEQKRRQTINDGFRELREAIGDKWAEADKNSVGVDSKAATLRKAVQYIRHLQKELQTAQRQNATQVMVSQASTLPTPPSLTPMRLAPPPHAHMNGTISNGAADSLKWPTIVLPPPVQLLRNPHQSPFSNERDQERKTPANSLKL